MYNGATCLNVTSTGVFDFGVVVWVNSCSVVEIFIVNNGNVFVPGNIDPDSESKLLHPGLAFKACVACFVD